MTRLGMSVMGVMAVSLLAGVLGNAQAGEPVAEALQRHAIAVSDPGKAFLIDADIAGSNIVAVGERGLVLLSGDGGQSWQQSRVPVSTGLNAVHFIDSRHGMAVGHGGSILGSSDGGAIWTLLLDGRQAAELAMASARERRDEVAAREAQRMIDDGPDKPFLDVLMLTRERALVVGAYGMAFITSDAGASWSPVMQHTANPDMLHFYAVRQQDKRIVLVGEQGLINLSEDDGLSYRKLDSPYGGSLFTVELEHDGSLLIAGLKGNVWRSRDGGDSWQQLDNPVAASITASRRLADGSVLLASQAGMLLQVSGSRVIPVSRDRLPPLNAFVPTTEGMLLLTVDGVRHSGAAR